MPRGPLRRARRGRAGRDHAAGPADAALFDSLRQWRAAEANREKKPAFTVFADKTLREIATSRPAGLHELKRVSGVGPAKLERYGDAVVAIVASAAVPAT